MIGSGCRTLLFCLCLALAGCTSSFDAARPLVLAPDVRLPLSQVDGSLAGVFAAGKPVLVYVHGRGDEPAKSAKLKLLENLERSYGVKVLMLNWDSKGILLQRPVQRAKDGAVFLRELATGLMAYRRSHPAAAAVPVSLLVHSMGSIVLREALEQGERFSDAGGPLFTNILITGSDEDAAGHELWVQKLPAAGTLLITANADDIALAWSKHPGGSAPLGLGPVAPLAGNAWYLDVTGLAGREHRLFLTGRTDSAAVDRILIATLRGEAPDLTAKNIARTERERILHPVPGL